MCRRRETGLLLACAALAAGEFAASLIVGFCEGWPAVLIVAAMVAMFGYGLGVRGWHLLFLFLLGAGLFLRASVAEERHFQQVPWMRGRRVQVRAEAPSGVIGAVRRDLSRRVAIGLDYSRETVALNRAILLGERARLPYRTKRVFVESGTIHVFAISGLHVMAVAWLLVFVSSLFFIPRRWAGIVAMVVLWGYVMLIGSPPSAVRAASMASIYYAAAAFFRRPNGLRAWALTFLVFHLVAPTMMVNVGSALSFIVMLSIILAGELVRGRGGLMGMVAVTFAAWAGGVPIAAHVFGRVTPGSMLANLLLVPVAGVSVVCGMLGMLISFVSERLAAHFNNLAALCTEAMVGVSELVSRLPLSNIEVENWNLVTCIGWYAAMLGILFLCRSCRRREVF